MDELESWELTDFNIDGHIALSQKFGQLKMMRSEDGLLILAEYANYGRIDQEKDTPTGFFDPESTLGFILDIGIQKKKRLTVGHGFYFGTKMIPTQSTRKVSQADFDKELFEKIGTIVELNFQSGDKQKELEAMRVQYLINEYNNARLLYPNFYADSYLSLKRIIDALSEAEGAGSFATFVSKISPELNKEIYEKIKDKISKKLKNQAINCPYCSSKKTIKKGLIERSFRNKIEGIVCDPVLISGSVFIGYGADG